MVTQETEYSHTPTVRFGFFFFGKMVEEQFVLTIETEHSQHVNVIGFFFFFKKISGGNLEQWWRSNVESQTETNGKTMGLNTKRRERERELDVFFSLGLEISIECNK